MVRMNIDERRKKVKELLDSGVEITQQLRYQLAAEFGCSHGAISADVYALNGNRTKRNRQDEKPVIYALVDPRTDRVHYVGRTTQNPKRRAQPNLKHSHTPRKLKWIRDLQAEGLLPKQIILEEVTSGTIQDRELWWIEEMTRRGEPLTNYKADGSLARQVILLPQLLEEIQTLGNGDLTDGVLFLLEHYRSSIDK